MTVVRQTLALLQHRPLIAVYEKNFVTSERSDTEAGREVQVSWGCIYEWQKARRRTEYPNRQG